MSESSKLVQIVEAALLAAGKPLTVPQIAALFERTFELSLEPQVPELQAATFAKKQDLLTPLKNARPLELAVRADEPMAVA